MLRVFLSANPSPDEFWNSTFDEVLLVIKGLIDRQRIERRNAYLIHCSMVERPLDMFELLPLPYDEELKQDGPGEISAEDFYKLTKDSGYLNNEWWKDN